MRGIKNMSVGIYKIENNINHKIYIGQSIDIEKRWLCHKFLGQNLKDYDTSYYIHAALNKYGIENFKFSIIETCKPEELNDREMYWISQYNTYIDNPNSWGYNLTPGGSNQSDSLKLQIDQYDLQGNFLKTFDSISEVERQGISSCGNIVNCLKKRTPSSGGYQWRYHGEEAPEEIVYKVMDDHNWSSSKKSIDQFTKNNEYIATFNSAHDAARSLEGHKNSGHISECCLGKRKTAYGYIWKYHE